MARHQGRTALYRLYDQFGALLYVGVSHKPDVRWGQHSEEKEWWPSVDRRVVEWHETRFSAEQAEMEAIRSEKPLHNTIGTPAATVSATGGKTPLRPIRVEGSLWEEFGRSSGAVGSDRSTLLRAFMAWHAHRPGAELPARPAVTPASEGAAE